MGRIARGQLELTLGYADVAGWGSRAEASRND